MSIERYLAGNRVYRHGSSAPTRGTVDPSGYVERELRNRMLSQEPSQSRSGLAQAALQRLQMNRQPMSGVPNTTPTWASRPPMQSGAGFQGGGAPVGNSALAAKLAAVRAEHMAEADSQKQALAAKMALRPKVSSTGKITTTKKPAPRPTALPWDQEANQGKLNAGYSLGQLRNQLMSQRQGAQREYSSGFFGLDQQQPEAERGLLNNFGGRGLAHGSGYGMGVGQLQNQFATERSGLAERLNDLISGYDREESAGTANYNRQLALIQQALAQRLSKRAGTLGFGPVK